MSNYFLIFVTWLLLIPAGCSDRKRNHGEHNGSANSYPFIIGMEDGLKNNAVLKLSEIADSIRYVVLDKKKEVLIGTFRRLQMSGNDIYINSGGLIMRFDSEGRYMNSFGRNGRGPEEYLPGSPYTTTPDNESVIISKGVVSEYLVFRPDGKFSGKKNFPDSGNMFDFTSISDSSFLITYFYIGRSMKREYLETMTRTAGLLNSKGMVLGAVKNPIVNKPVSDSDLKRVIISNPTYTYYNNNAILSPEGDTIYVVNKDSIFPGFIIDWGNVPHQQTEEELYYMQSVPTEKVVNYMPLFETSHKAYFCGRNLNKYFVFQYDKVTGSCRSMTVSERAPGIINDLDGGSKYFPYWTNRSGNIWIAYEDAFSFKKNHSDTFLLSSPSIRDEMKEKLRRFCESLKQDDNPVLKIVYLKK